MSTRYFVDPDTGRCFGKVFAVNPANPNNYNIVVLEHPIAGDPFKMVYRDGAFHWADDADERLAKEARAIRAERLRKTDWTQLDDVPAVTRAQWVAYRKALRDITEQPDFPRNIIWPDEPK